jgi:hypothetical protein
MNYFEDQEESVPPAQRNWLSEPIIKLVTAVTALGAAILTVFGHNQKAFFVVFLGCGLVIVWFLAGVLRNPIRRLVREYGNRRYVAREYGKLKLLFERLGKFTSKDDGRSFRHEMYSASAYRLDIIDKILGADYIEDWLRCYTIRLEFPCQSVVEFLSRCREFTTIVNHYNTNYVIKTQKTIEASPVDILPVHCLDQFEEFRERFSAYLNEIEQWADAIARDVKPRVSLAHFLEHVPRSFTRARSFKKVDVALLVQKNRAAG